MLTDGSARVWGRNRSGEASVFKKDEVLKKSSRLSRKYKVKWVECGANCTLWRSEDGTLHGSGKVGGKWIASTDALKETMDRFPESKEGMIKLEGEKGEEIKVEKVWIGQSYVIIL